MRRRWLPLLSVSVSVLLAGGIVAAASVAGTAHASTPGAVDQEALDPCVLINGGTISGTVSHAGAPAPNGTLLSLIFSSGPAVDAVATDGHYTAPLLARACADGVHWVSFEFWIGGRVQSVTPTGWDTRLDVNAPNPITITRAASFPNGAPPLCTLQLGTISGAVEIDGMSAPDGTVVSATSVMHLNQAVLTNGGRYMLTSVGSRCKGGRGTFLAMTLSVDGVSVDVTPARESTSQDLTVPSTTETSQGPSTAGP